MPVPLIRRPHDQDAYDVDTLRQWMLDRVRGQVRLGGQAKPCIHLVADGHELTLDLDAVSRDHPGASIGATWVLVRQRSGYKHAFLVAGLRGESEEGEVATAALVVQEHGGRLWIATLPYTRDVATGLGHPEEWQLAEGRGVPDMLLDLLLPAPGSHPAQVIEPRAPVADIQAAFGALPDEAPLPESAEQLSVLVARMVVPSILREGLRGTVVLRFVGREWEWWVLGNDQPVELDEMIRAICHREPQADAVALVIVALFEAVEPHQPGIQMIVEGHGARHERWVLLELESGSDGPRRAGQELNRSRPLPREGHRWLGEAPTFDIELFPLGMGEA